MGQIVRGRTAVLILGTFVPKLSTALTLCTDSGCTQVAEVSVQLAPLKVNGRPAHDVSYNLGTGRVTAYEVVIFRDSME